MEESQARVRVDLGVRGYDIEIGRGLLNRVGELAAVRLPGRRAAIIASETVAKHYSAVVRESFQKVEIQAELIDLPDGEECKAMWAVERGLGEMARLGMDRRSIVVALGGGAIGDAAGFIASIYMRGVPYIQVPTTLLAMVDSSVGGKTGVNLPEGKNLVGSFLQPRLVVIDPDTLKTLADREFRSGIAEVIKYGAIRDASLFRDLAEGRPEDWIPVVAKCCSIKARIVEQDEFETKDVRALLNFGHTLGHAIEANADFGRLLHGEAVAVGTIGAAYLSVLRAGLSPEEADSIRDALLKHELPVSDPELDAGKVFDYLKRDKKFRDGKMRFVLLPRLGEAIVSDAVTEADVREAIQLCKGVDVQRMIA